MLRVPAGEVSESFYPRHAANDVHGKFCADCYLEVRHCTSCSLPGTDRLSVSNKETRTGHPVSLWACHTCEALICSPFRNRYGYNCNKCCPDGHWSDQAENDDNLEYLLPHGYWPAVPQQLEHQEGPQQPQQPPEIATPLQHVITVNVVIENTPMRAPAMKEAAPPRPPAQVQADICGYSTSPEAAHQWAFI